MAKKAKTVARELLLEAASEVLDWDWPLLPCCVALEDARCRRTDVDEAYALARAALAMFKPQGEYVYWWPLTGKFLESRVFALLSARELIK